MNRRRRGRTTKACCSSGFMGFFGDFRTLLDVAGSLWSWDGCPPHCESKSLFSRVFKFPLSEDAPLLPLPNVGCLEKALDVGSGFTEAQSRDASRCASQGALEAHLGGTPSDACLIGSVPSSAS
jgi:hypothetical protein